jgi:NAD(P)-dependent dehydrogenase (short-subunit alcohol dehydrogenase family)
MHNEFRRAAVVTGAASGIGRSVGTQLLDKNYAVCLVDVRPLDSVLDDLTEFAGSVVAVQGNIADPTTMANACKAASQLGVLTAAVLNAGVLTGQPDLNQLSMDRYAQVIDANITGVVNGLRAFMGAVGQNPGTVVVTASSTGLVPAPHDPVYAMTKHAVVGLVRSLSLNPRYENLRLNCICPNGVDTPMLGDALKSGRVLLSPADVASRIIELLGSEATGQAWVCTTSKFEPFQFPDNPGYEFPTLTASA